MSTTETELGKLASAYVALKQKEKQISKQLEELKEQIVTLSANPEYLGADADKFNKGEAVIVTCGTKAFTVQNATIVQSRLDTKQLKADHGELYAEYCVQSVQNRFTVK